MPGNNVDTDRVELTCPLCTLQHDYDVTATYLEIRAYDSSGDEPYDVDVTRIFTCPVKDDEFEATLRMTERPTRRLTGVNVSLAGE